MKKITKKEAEEMITQVTAALEGMEPLEGTEKGEVVEYFEIEIVNEKEKGTGRNVDMETREEDIGVEEEIEITEKIKMGEI